MLTRSPKQTKNASRDAHLKAPETSRVKPPSRDGRLRWRLVPKCRPKVRVETPEQLGKRLRQEAWQAREKESDQLRQYEPWLRDSEAEGLISFLRAAPRPADIEEATWREMTGLDRVPHPAEFKRLVNLLIPLVVRRLVKPKKV